MDKQKPRTKSYKKSYKRKRSSTKAIVYKQIQQQIRRNAEKKFYDESYLINGLDISGSLNSLAEPGQGTQVDEYIGAKITVTSVEVNMTLFSPGLATTAPYNQTRVTLFTWKGQNTPTLAEIYQVTTVDFEVLAPFNHTTKKLRKIHYDMVFDQYYVNANGFAQDPIKTVKFVVPMANAKGRINEITYDNAGPTNQIYLFVISNNNGAANTKWLANVYTRVNYLDM